MSLERDVTEIMEANIFKPAGKKELTQRQKEFKATWERIPSGQKGKKWVYREYLDNSEPPRSILVYDDRDEDPSEGFKVALGPTDTAENTKYWKFRTMKQAMAKAKELMGGDPLTPGTQVGSEEIVSEADVFKPASGEEMQSRQAELKRIQQQEKEKRLAALKAKGIPEVDDKAGELDGDVWEAEKNLHKRLAELRREHADILDDGDECQCHIVLDEIGGDMEYCTVSGENGYMDAYCLRCGGKYEAW